MTLQHLRQATRARHVALESRSMLMDPALSRSAYLDCLRRFFGYYAPLELKLLKAACGSHPELVNAQRQKAPLLAHDLISLGLAHDELGRLPRCHVLPDLSSTARLFGCLYVLEGATLGGQIVSRHLLATLGITSQCGGAFFGGYGDRTGSRWKAFGSQLTAFAGQSASEDEAVASTNEMVASANETFETLGNWLYPPQWPRRMIDEPASQSTGWSIDQPASQSTGWSIDEPAYGQ